MICYIYLFIPYQHFYSCFREDREFLLVSARQEILRFNLLNPDAGLQPLPIPHLSMVIAIDFDLANNCIFWSDVNTRKIHVSMFSPHCKGMAVCERPPLW